MQSSSLRCDFPHILLLSFYRPLRSYNQRKCRWETNHFLHFLLFSIESFKFVTRNFFFNIDTWNCLYYFYSRHLSINPYKKNFVCFCKYSLWIKWIKWCIFRVWSESFQNIYGDLIRQWMRFPRSYLNYPHHGPCV